MAYSALVAPCLAIDLKPQALLNSLSINSELKWGDCGELSDHTVECKDYLRPSSNYELS